MSTDAQGTSRFVVDLGTVVVPPTLAAAIEAEIRRVVLHGLAWADLPDVPPASERAAPPPLAPGEMMTLGLPDGILYGLIFDPEALPDPPPTCPPELDCNPF